MKYETIMPILKIGSLLFLAGAAGSAATTAMKPSEQKATVVECKCNCNHPPIRGELIFKK